MTNRNDDFDFESFATTAIAIIDSIRSKGRDGAESPVEPRINALYRAIGLPSIFIVGTDNKERVRTNPGLIRIDPENTSNKFNDTDISLTPAERTVVINRLQDAALPITEAEKTKTFDFNRSKVEDALETRVRGKLFPMIVNGDINVWPLNRRVGGAFLTNEELTRDRVQYHRPLIELIILLRLKKEGLVNSQTQGSISTAIQGEVSVLGEEIIEAFQQSLYNLGDIAEIAVQRINSVRKSTGVDVTSQPGAVPQNAKTVITSSEKRGELDKQLAEQNRQLALKEARLQVFEYEDGAGESISRNMKTALFADIILNTITGASGRLKKDISATKQKREKKIGQLKEAHKELDFLFGTFSGVSGTDIAVIIVAMLLLDMPYLVGLLNESTRERLYNKIGTGKVLDKNGATVTFYPIESSTLSVGASLGELKRQVRELVVKVDQQIVARAFADKGTKQKKERTSGGRTN